MIAKKTETLAGAPAPRPSRLNPLTWLGAMTRRYTGMGTMIDGLKRRHGWFLTNLTPRKVLNLAMVGVDYALKRERVSAMPVVVKIDISPACNLSCTTCVHADANGNPALERQEFSGKQRMSVEQYRKIIDQIKGAATAVSLYYLGDPLVHPEMDEMSRIAFEAGLNVHISTNFSFVLSDDRIRRLVQSGLTHLSVCVDGLSQEKYQLTRVGGKIDRVLNNLERVVKFKRELGRKYPHVEVQYIKFQHNVDELEPARKRFETLGVDQFTDFWGDLGNYTDRDPENLTIRAPRENKRLPQCQWPHGSIVIKYNGDVIPCCTYRHGTQYAPDIDPRVLGNVFETSVRDVWNGKGYQEARRLVNNPEVIKLQPELANHFCHGCGAIFETNDQDLAHHSAVEKWEDVYVLGEDGRPIRKQFAGAVNRIGLPDGQTVSV